MSSIKTFKLLLLLSSIAITAVYGQSEPNARSAIFDEAAYNQLPRRATLTARSYEGLPRSFSLKQYAPTPGNQTDYGTCVGWAAAYAARTISESVALDRRDRAETTRNAFSPNYIYRRIRPDDPEGQKGAAIFWALDVMRDSGPVKMLEIEHKVGFTRMTVGYYTNARRFPIAGYVTLFSREDRQKPAFVTRMVKKSLTEGKPVIIGMNTPNSFIAAEETWLPTENPRFFYGGHALCVVGYDDDRDGGAFEVMNSWGTKWGNGGFIWIPYDVFINFVMESYELIENLVTYSDSVQFSGFTRVEIIETDEPRQAELVFSDGLYRATEVLTGGTSIRYVTGAGESAYVYAFSVSQNAHDGTYYAPVLMFPQTGISPLLNYRDSEVVFPNEEKTLDLRMAPATEYLIVLHAKQALDLPVIMGRFYSARGEPRTRLAAAVGTNLILDLEYAENEAAFTAEPENPRAVAAYIIAIEHR